MAIVYSTEILEAKTKTGKTKFWQGHLVKVDDNWFTQTAFWQTDSIVQFSTPYQAYGVNKGKKNEKTPEADARATLESMFKKQQDKGYNRLGEIVLRLPFPMLATRHRDKKAHIVFPAYVQPKLNGMRMLSTGTTQWSRGNKIIDPTIISHLAYDSEISRLVGIEGLALDGELILPGNVLLQETMRAANKFRSGISDRLQYHVYDIVDPTGTIPFEARYKLLSQMVEKIANPNILLVQTAEVKSTEEIYDWQSKFTNLGYEGTMIRNAASPYLCKYKSNDLQKLKYFLDDEFLILDIKEGEGSSKNTAIFICDNSEGATFDCTPEGSFEVRHEYFINRESYIGKYLTVRYQELTEENMPTFAVGISIREREDFS